MSRPVPLLRKVALLWFAAPVVLRAQGVRLEVSPRPGDTLCTELDQRTEIRGTRWISGTTATTSQVSSRLKMFSRAIVQTGHQPLGPVTVLAITDSLSLESTDSHAQILGEEAKRMLEGRRIRLLVHPNGLVQVASDSGDPSQTSISTAVSLMPPPFPSLPVHIGQSWSREMPLSQVAFTSGGLQVAGPTAVRPERPRAKLHTTFRFDSLSADGRIAFLSMRGSLIPDFGGPASSSVGGREPRGVSVSDGTVAGSLELDRRRGWLLASAFRIVVHSTLSGDPSGTRPMEFETRITQRSRTAPKR